MGLGEMILQMVQVDADAVTCEATGPRGDFECSGWVWEVGGCVPMSPRGDFECSGWAREVGRCVPTSPR